MSEAKLVEKTKNLPNGWEVEVRQRKSGASTGIFDTYYFAPSGRAFRSKSEVDKSLAASGDS